MHAPGFDLKRLWKDCVDNCDGRLLVADTFADLSSVPGPVHVLSLGKAAGSMAAGAADVLGRAAGRIVVAGGTTEGVPEGAEIHIGEHPSPKAGSFAAGRAMLSAASRIRSTGEKVLALVSGGGSSLCEVPAEGLCEEDLTVAHRALVYSGAPIETMNRIRRRLSAIKGGGLARALGPSLSWEGALVDIPSGDSDAVASGPFRLASAGPPDPVDRRVLGTPRTLAEKAAGLAREQGASEVRLRPEVVSGLGVEALGEEIVKHLVSGGGLFVATGEVSVPLPQPGPLGRGGRAQHLASWVLHAARNRVPAGRRWAFLAAGSDGRDGEGAAGALVDGESAASEQELRRSLETYSTGELHERMGTLLPEHAPRTNLTDLYLAWVE